MKLRNRSFLTSAILAFASAAQAQSTWNLTSGDSWNSAGNWIGGIPDSNTAIADFTQDFTGSPIITLDNLPGFTINRINYEDTGATDDSTLEVGSGTGGILTLAGTTPTISIAASDPVSATLTTSIELTGAVSLTKTGAGTLALASVNTYTGGTIVSEGTLRLNIGGGTGAIRNALTVNAGTSVVVSAANGLGNTQFLRIGNIALRSTLDIQNTGNNSITSATITMTGGTLTGMTGSKFDLRNNGAGNANVTTLASATTSLIDVPTLGLPNNNSTLNVASGTTASGIDLLISSNIVNNAGTGGSGTGTSSLTKTGVGTLSLSGTNTFTGDTNANVGTILLASQNALQSSALNSNGAVVIFDSSVVGNAFTFGGLKGIGNLTLANNAVSPAAVALTVGGNNSDTLYSGELSGAGNLVKTGTGVLTLTGTNTFAGSLAIATGTVRAASSSSIGNNGTLIGNNGASNTTFASADDTALVFTKTVSTNAGGGGISFGDATGTGDLTFTGNLTRAGGATNRTVNVAGSTTVTFNGNLLSPGTPTGSTTFFKGGTGTLTIKGTGSTSDLGFSKVVVTGGTMAVTRLADLGVASSLSKAMNATAGAVSINLDGGELRYIDGGGAASSTNRLLQIGRTTTAAVGTIRNNATNAAHTVTFSNTDAIAYGTVDQTRTLVLGGTNTGTNTFASVIGNNGTAAVSLTKEDAGKWSLTGTNTYSGDTTVSAGTLSLASAFLADASAVRIATGGTLDLPHGAEDTIAELWIDGVQLSPDTYTSGNKPGLISGTGSLVVTSGPPPGGAYDSWLTASSLTPGNPGTAPNESYDKSGVANILQFALGGDVLDPSKNGIQQIFTKDASIADNLVLTVAVRSGATFVGSPSPGATLDGITYTILGSSDLSAFTTGVEEVAVQNGSGSVIAPLGYTLKSFRLVQAPALSSKGFMRVEITQP